MNNEPIALQLADALLRNNQQSINIEAAAELRMQNNALINADDTRNRLIRRVTELEARIAELEAQLEAIGAGGVEPLRKRECLHQISPEHSILGIFLSAMSDQLKIDGPAMRDAMLWYCGVQEIATEPQPAAQALDVQVLMRVIQRLNQNPYSLTKSECISEIEAMRDAASAAQGGAW